MFHKLLVAVVLLSLEIAAADPQLCFSDLTSGPKSGNSDTSRGQAAAVDGCIVTVWGKNLGSTQGTSKIFCNGAEARVYSWGNATAPADLYTRHQMQMVCFQISGSAVSGGGTIFVTVNGVASNTLPFTVRTGRIFFVKTTGSDTTGDGSWAKPFRGMPRAIDAMAAGDITYVGDGVSQTAETDYGAAVNLSQHGTQANPLAFVAYPGATVNVGSDSCQRGFHVWESGYGYVNNWVLSKFRVRSGEVAIVMGSDFRVVGNFVTTPTASAPEGAIEGDGNNLYVMGNELTAVGKVGCSKLYHPIYISSARSSVAPRNALESNREIAWNYLHDNNANRGINIYSEQDYTAYMSNHRVHDNFIINQTGGGMLLGTYMTGENYVYNNVIANAGLGPEPSDGNAQSHIGVEIQPGVDGGPATTMYFYNNTIYGCGWGGATIGSSANGNLSIDNLTNYTLKFFNNVIVSTGQPYLASGRSPVSARDTYSCWYGAGAPPSWDTHAYNADPKFAGASGFNFHLQSTSPLIDKGTNAVATLVTRDFDGISRPQGAGYEPGAYEFATGSPPPPPPAAPTITTQPQSVSVASGQTTTFNVGAAGTAPLAYQWQRLPAGGSTWSNVGSNSASYATPPTTISDSGSSYRVIVSNSAGTATSNSATLTVTSSNRAPVATDQSVTTSKNTAVSLQLRATDADGDALTYIIVTQPQHGTLEGTAPNLTYTPTRKYNGSDSFTFRASDGRATSNTATVSIAILRHAPTITSALNATPNPAPVGQVVAFPFSATDADGDVLSYNWSFGDGSLGEGSSATHSFAMAGSYSVALTITDEDGMSVSGSVLVTIVSNNPGGGGGDGGADQIVDLGTVKLNSRVRISLPLPDVITNKRGLTLKALSPLPPVLRISGSRLSGRAKQAGAFAFDVKITKRERVVDSTGRHLKTTELSVKYKLTVEP